MNVRPFEPEPWMVDAACRNADPGWFFPSEGERPSKDSIRRTLNAKVVCHGCPVRLFCLEYAYRTGDKWAVLGGETPAERESRLAQVSA